MNLSRILSIILLVSATTQSTDLLSMKRTRPDKSTPHRRSARIAQADTTTLAQSLANKLKAAQRGPTKRRKTQDTDDSNDAITNPFTQLLSQISQSTTKSITAPTTSPVSSSSSTNTNILPPPAGLVNSLGCSCYINAVLQCLCSLEHLNPLINKIPNTLTVLQKQLIQTLRAMRSPVPNSLPFNPLNFAQQAAQTLFETPEYQQQDAQEFFSGLIGNRCFNQSQPGALQQLFSIPTKYQITCKHSKKKKNPTLESNYIISLNITQPQEGQPRTFVYNCINNFLAPHEHPQDYHCDYCYDEINKKVRCHQCNQNPSSLEKHCIEQRTLVANQSTPPSILAIQLKRFDYNDGGKKIFTPVSIATTMALTFKDIVHHQTTFTRNYSLKALVWHNGISIYSGHYGALVKRNNSWFLCNDEYVTQMTCPITAIMRTAQQQLGSTTVSYLLFYELQPATDNTPNFYIEESANSTVSPLHSFTTTTTTAISSSSSPLLAQQPQPPQLQPSYNQQDYEKACKGGKDLRGANLRGAKFIGTMEHPIDLSGVDFSGADLTGTVFEHVNLSRAILIDTNFSGTRMKNTDLTETTLTRVKIIQATLEQIRLERTKFIECNLSNTTIDNAFIDKTTIKNSDLSNAILKNFNCEKLKIKHSLLISVTFNNLDLLNCTLKDLNMQGATLIKVCFNATVLNSINFKGATINGLLLFNNHYIGSNLNFEKATIENSIILGKSTANSNRINEIKPQWDLMPNNWKGAAEIIFFPISISVEFVQAVLTGEGPLEKWSINSIITNVNFSNTKFRNVWWSYTLFKNCTGINKITQAAESIFNHVIFEEALLSDNLESLLRSKGAKVNSDYDHEQFGQFWSPIDNNKFFNELLHLCTPTIAGGLTKIVQSGISTLL